MFDLELNQQGLIRGEVMQEALLYFGFRNYRKSVNWSIGVLVYISQCPPNIANVRWPLLKSGP